MPLTIDDITRVQEKVILQWAEEAIAEGRGTLMDYWTVAYIKGTPEERKKLGDALEEACRPWWA
jgi:hypothetical protein